MPILTKYFTLIVAFILLVFSGIAILINYSFTQYPGNNYLFTDLPIAGMTVVLSLAGLYLLFGKESPYVQMSLQLFYFFLVVAVITFATTAIQFTPFQPIDQQLLALDQALAINLEKIVAYSSKISGLRKILIFSYNSLNNQITYIPIILILARKFTHLKDFYALTLLSALIGFSLYYFFPTMGPASNFINSSFFSQEQFATGIKFTEIHHHIPPSTNEGGLIAMPSFHVIWAWLITYLVRCWPIAFFCLLPLNLLLTLSCVMLGWHYLVDLIASLIVLFISHQIYYYCVKQHQFLSQFSPMARRHTILKTFH